MYYKNEQICRNKKGDEKDQTGRFFWFFEKFGTHGDTDNANSNKYAIKKPERNIYLSSSKVFILK